MRTMNEQADAVLKKHKAFGVPKRNADLIGKTQFKKFTSVRSYNNTVSTLATVGKNLGVSRLNEITPEMAINYLQDRKEQHSKTKIIASEKHYDTLSQKTIDAERKALSILLEQNIERVYTPAGNRNASRAYTSEQIAQIKESQTESNRLSTEIARASGLRATELLTISRLEEDSKTTERNWRNDRFEGMDGVKYVVKGKGGLKREVMIPKHLSVELEKKRLEQPKIVYDRGVKIISKYDISGGQKFSQSFCDASNRSLGFSQGAHGLRHSYAKQRFEILRSMGKTDLEAKTIVSQELGHFRPQITEVYLR